MKKILLAGLLLATVQLHAQTFEWARPFGGTSTDVGNSIGVDAIGNVYTAGNFEGTSDFDPGVGTANLTSVGNTDIFIQKMDAAGNFLWAKSFGGTLYDYAYDLSIDASGNIYTTGTYKGTVDFDPESGTTNLVSVGNTDIFVHKMDTDGNFLWARSMGGTSSDEGRSISVDASGNVYTTGTFRETVDFDPGVGVANLTSEGINDIFVQKMDADGNFLWVKSMGGNSNDLSRSINVDGSGNVYTTGYFWGTADFDPGTGTTELTSNGEFDIFIQKMDASGSFLWARSMGGSSSDYGYSIDVDASGNVYTTGNFEETVDFEPGLGTTNLISLGGSDVFVQKMDADGNFLWARSFGGISADYGNSIDVDAQGNVYTAGYFQATADFDPGIGTADFTSSGAADTFIQKMDANGNFLWAGSMGGTSNDLANSVSVDVAGNIYTTGYFAGTADLDPSAGISEHTTLGLTDIFVQKLSSITVGLNNGVKSAIEAIAYPNPTTGTILVEFEQTLEDVQLMLTDAAGKLIHIQSYNTLSNANVELPEAAGTYLLTIRASAGQSTMILQKE